MFPAQLHLKTKTANTPQNFTISILNYIKILYQRINLTSFFILKDVLSSCLSLVATSGSSAQPSLSPSKPLDEDSQIAVCECLQQMMKARDGSVCTEMFSPSSNMKLPLSHLVFTCLSWALEEKVSCGTLRTLSRASKKVCLYEFCYRLHLM